MKNNNVEEKFIQGRKNGLLILLLTILLYALALTGIITGGICFENGAASSHMITLFIISVIYAVLG